jgi:type I restriction enzyme S subunit
MATLGGNLRERSRNGYSPKCPANPTGSWILSLGAVTPHGFNPHAVKPAPIEDPKIAENLLVPGDVLVSRSNTRERVGLAGVYRGKPTNCHYPDLLMRVRPSPDSLDTDFLGQFLLSSGARQYFRTAARGTSGSMVKIDRGILERLPIAMPPLGEQRKIAAILASVDETIEKTGAVIAQLQVVKKAMMQELLTRGLPGRHTRFRHTELGELPERWRLTCLQEVSSLITDGTHQPVKTSFDGDGIQFLFVSCIRDGRISWDAAKRISRDVYLEISRGREPEAGDILYTAVGSYGHAAMIDSDNPFSFQRHIAYIKPNRAMVEPRLILHLLNSPMARRHADRVAVGNAQKTVTLQELRRFPLQLPPLDEQRQIADCLDSIGACFLVEKCNLDGLINLKSALMSVLLTGEVRVTPDKDAP